MSRVSRGSPLGSEYSSSSSLPFPQLGYIRSVRHGVPVNRQVNSPKSILRGNRPALLHATAGQAGLARSSVRGKEDHVWRPSEPQPLPLNIPARDFPGKLVQLGSCHHSFEDKKKSGCDGTKTYKTARPANGVDTSGINTARIVRPQLPAFGRVIRGGERASIAFRQDFIEPARMVERRLGSRYHHVTFSLKSRTS